MKFCNSKTCRVLLLFGALHFSSFSRANQSDAILQYFGTSWNDIALKMPELAEAGYTALWLPPPFKGTSVWDVGFGTFDRFDLGDKDQSGTIPTKYGTAAELQNLIETAHRFGLRIYFDNVMAHNGGPIPGSDETPPSTPSPALFRRIFTCREPRMVITAIGRASSGKKMTSGRS